jgi:hypothetical protein
MTITPASGGKGFRRRTFLAGSAAAAGAGFALSGAANAGGLPASGGPGVTADGFPLTGSSVRVLITGDAGTGEAPQYAVTKAARALHAQDPFGLAIGLGDNIYESGPNGPDDKQFAEKFEKPNTGLDFPWVMALGNHDTTAVFPGDGGWLLRGDAEVAYHSRSDRWYMPRRYFSVAVPEQAPIVEFFVLDLNPIAAYIPPFLAPYWEPNGTYMTAQRNWLREAVEASTATWKIACTHHPYINNGPHGSAGGYDGIPIPPINGVLVKEFFEREIAGRFHFFMSGHDHSLQVFDPTLASKGTRQLVSGAAAKSVEDTSSKEFPALYENYRDRGFMTMDITSSSIDLKVFTVDLAAGTPSQVFAKSYSG